MGNNPFIPVKFPPGPPTAQKGVYEDGPGAYVNPSNSTNVVRYNGQDQTARINTASPMPPWEDGPNYGDGQGIKAVGTPIGSGLAAIQHQTTQYPGPAQAVTAGTPAQLSARVDSSGNLHFYDNVTNKGF